MIKDVAIVIPALNEAASIGSVIEASSKYGTIIVVDDGSTDSTREISLAAGAIVITHPDNLGYEAALESGLNRASSIGCLYAVTLDADGQHDPRVLARVITELDNGYDLILGCRDKMQRLSETIFSIVGKLRWGIKDPLCGVKGYRLELFRQYGPFRTFNSIGVEFAVKLVKLNVKFKEIQVATKPRNGVSRFGAGIFVNIAILKVMIRLL